MKDIGAFASEYIADNIKILQSLDPNEIAQAVELVVRAGESGNRIYAIGNGGSVRHGTLCSSASNLQASS